MGACCGGSSRLGVPNLRPLGGMLGCQWWWTGLGGPQAPRWYSQALGVGVGLSRSLLRPPHRGYLQVLAVIGRSGVILRLKANALVEAATAVL